MRTEFAFPNSSARKPDTIDTRQEFSYVGQQLMQEHDTCKKGNTGGET